MRKVLVCGSGNFQNWRESYFWPKKLHEKVRETRQNGGKYNARQSWPSKNTTMTNKYQNSDPLTFSTEQFLVKLAIELFEKSPFLVRSVMAKLANHAFSMSVVDNQTHFWVVQIIRIDDPIHQKPLSTTYKCTCPTWERNSGPHAEETAGTYSRHSANPVLWIVAFACYQ